jgi:hypothetical protein
MERKPEDIEIAKAHLKEARLKSKKNFDKRHHLHPKKIEEGDWVLLYDNSLDNQQSTTRKFAKRWFGSYVGKKVEGNATYLLAELGGIRLALAIAGKRIKIFKRRSTTDVRIEVLDYLILSIEDSEE